MSMIGNIKSIDPLLVDELLDDPEKIHNVVHPDEPEEGTDSLDIDKSWHAIHFILTGKTWEGDFPGGFLVSCGLPIGDEDVGYGPARAFRPDEVRQIALFLTGVDKQIFEERFSIEKMKVADLYPSFGAHTKEEEIPYFWQYFEDMKQFIQRASEEGKAILVYLD